MLNFPECHWNRLFAATAVTSLLAVAPPAQAFEVIVQPPRPVLGDTLSILVQGDSSSTPTVTVGGKTYPVFPLSANRWRAFVPTTPLDSSGKRALVVSGGGETRNMAVWVGDRRFPVQSIWLPPGKDSDVSDFEFDRVDAFKALMTPQKFWQGAFVRPNSGPLTTGYGIRRYYNGVFAKDYYHRGVDYAGGTGSAVVAAAAGRVALVGRESQGFRVHGNVVGINHGQGVLTIYLHLKEIKVRDGDQVRSGQLIGTVGSTGAATGPHLHWGLYVDRQAVDPRSWLTQGWE